MRVPFHPEVFGDFLLVQRLEERPGVDVMLAVRLGDRSGRAFVLKRPMLGERASGGAARAITREAEVLEAVRAPNLASLEATGEIAGLPYLATEHVRGLPLDALLDVARLSPGAVNAIGVDLTAALAALHQAGWVHGDVSPSHVIVDDTGEARLCDLGSARSISERPGKVRPAQDDDALAALLASCAPAPAQRSRAAVDRAALAEIVEQATRTLAAAGPLVLTPTAPMVVPTRPHVPKTLVETRPAAPRRWTRSAAIAVTALLVGLVLGRVSARLSARYLLHPRLTERVAP